jgi:hypothetical protein
VLLSSACLKPRPYEQFLFGEKLAFSLPVQ